MDIGHTWLRINKMLNTVLQLYFAAVLALLRQSLTITLLVSRTIYNGRRQRELANTPFMGHIGRVWRIWMKVLSRVGGRE